MRRAKSTIEGVLRRSEKNLLHSFNSRKHVNTTNITKLKENILKYFRKHEEFIILLIDKKLGPYVINREEYLKQWIKHHLSDASTYDRISKDVAYEHMKKRRKIPGAHQTIRPLTKSTWIQKPALSSQPKHCNSKILLHTKIPQR